MYPHIISSALINRDHWILIAVLAKRNKVFYLDSLKSSAKHRKEAYSQAQHILNELVSQIFSSTVPIVLPLFPYAVLTLIVFIHVVHLLRMSGGEGRTGKEYL